MQVWPREGCVDSVFQKNRNVSLWSVIVEKQADELLIHPVFVCESKRINIKINL